MPKMLAGTGITTKICVGHNMTRIQTTREHGISMVSKQDG